MSDELPSRTTTAPEARTTHILSKAATEALNCPFFLKRFDEFKIKANAQVDASKREQGNSGEFEELTEEFVQEWKRVIDTELKLRAEKAGIADPQELPRQWTQKQIDQIVDLGYDLDDKAKETLRPALERFYVCNIGPAPFSVHSVEQYEREDTDITVTVSEHQLQVATHWLRHPPPHYTCHELEELVVLSLFHDVYYFDDFAHHGDRCVDLFKDYLKCTRPKELVGGHIYMSPKADKLRAMEFSDPEERLRQEWVQMDWYLSMVNMKQKSKVKDRIGDGCVLPFEFFHHQIGHMMTGDSVVQRSLMYAPGGQVEAAAWQQPAIAT